MSGVYDNWERLVEATLDRERLRRLALCDSFSTSNSSYCSPDHSDGDPEAPSRSKSSSYDALQAVDFEEIKKATGNFRYSFGRIYKGWIYEHSLTAAEPGSGTAIAVKKWDQEGQREWLAEIYYSSQYRHPKLVRLIGHSFDGYDRLLVYEFMPEGSLDNHLFNRHHFLSWETRIKVANDAATGLSFLHDAEEQVLHRNFKAAHVLLDAEFNAKLCDFSLAKDGPSGDRTHVSTRVMGTYGYVSPEYLATGCLTAKCDVYAFGIFLLELLSGRRIIDNTKDDHERYLVEWAKPFLNRKKKLSKIMDIRLKANCPLNEAYAVATLALKCLTPDPKQRPHMAEVVVQLQQIKGSES